MKHMRALSITAVFAILITGGIFLAGSEEAESQQPQEFPYAATGLGQDTYSFSDFTAGSVVEIAQSSCGSDTCSADQCCCLNTETGAQCCRPNTSGNCVESCKRGSPC